MKLDELKQYKKILILGYSKEGRATEQYLKACLSVPVIDHADLTDGDGYLQKQNKYDLIIKTPGIPKRFITRPYTTATNIFFANCPCPVIGVTGTKGKSTTASLIYHLLKAAGREVYLGGNIGTPALGILPYLRDRAIFVIEMSSYQLDDIKYSPHVSVILNLFPEHMNYHGDITRYYEAKKNIVKYVKSSDYFMYNPNYNDLRVLASGLRCRTCPFIPHTVPVSGNKLRLSGEHNKENIQAALSVADLFHVSKGDIIRALRTFKPLPHRLENVGTFHDIIFYDDAISTTPESTIVALQTLKNVGTLFLGGEDRGYDFSNLVKIVADKNIENIVLFPDSGYKIRELMKAEILYHPRVFETNDMEAAVRFAFMHTRKKNICLLSTASPSYSVWKNFEEKGDLFKMHVRSYEKI
jgi:UDP-N-acetylmuramoylalanine--D-glutamate ligase